MKAIALVLLLMVSAGCSRNPVTDISGKWYAFNGPRMTLEQNRHSITGTGEISTATSGPLPLTVKGSFKRDILSIVLDIETRGQFPIEYELITGSDGITPILKCLQHSGRSLFPEISHEVRNIDMLREITKKERQQESSQQKSGR
jgi:hypothetical protein